MMRHSELLGTHGGHDPRRMTVWELLDTLRQVPRQARHNYLMMVVSPSGSTELAALQFAQSDQAEKWDFRV